ncbi:MAG: hypothetical protein E7028_07235 [Planctomycetaceae bacterium]|nr:hypothetical protein [Planctomycetaceae bacterium]
MLNRIMKDESGVLTFEWILLITVLVIGLVGALSAVRDALNTELGDVAEAMVALDQSYYICYPWEVATPDTVGDGASDSFFHDGAFIYQERSADKTVEGTETAEGYKPDQGVTAVSSVEAEGTTNPNFTK